MFSETIEASYRNIDHNEEHIIAKTSDGRFLLAFALRQRRMIRPILEQPVIPLKYIKGYGGPSHNEFKGMDFVGAAAVKSAVKWRAKELELTHAALYVEEYGWITKPSHANRYFVLDTLDESSDVGQTNSRQTFGGVCIDPDGVLKSGIIVGLSPANPYILLYEDGCLQSNIPINHAYNRSDHIAYAMLAKRWPDLPPSRLKTENLRPAYPTFGGCAVFELALGAVDILVDLKGQPGYEAANWVSMASALGYPIVDPTGKSHHYTEFTQRFLEDPGSRIPFIIGSTHEAIDDFLPLLTCP